jgi:hypothetical protein
VSSIFPGRYTAQTEESFVVFLIGMRINRFWAFRKWLPVFRAMVPMIVTLNRFPEKGYLHGMTLIGSRGPVMVQYWRSFEDLEHFARNPSDPHLEAWKQFNRAVGSDGTVGIWHETYAVQPGGFEAVYGNMPRFGLAQAVEHIQIAGRRQTARGRLQAGQEVNRFDPAPEARA